MDKGLRINDAVTVIGQVRQAELEQAVQDGFRSVLNLRSPDELGFFKEEGAIAEALGLHYRNVPLKLEQIGEASLTRVLCGLDQLPKPVLVHCAAGMRSTAIALLSTAVQEGLTPEQMLERARSLGFPHVDLVHTFLAPHLVECFANYITHYADVIAPRMAA